jgi:allantoinase
LFGIDDRKGALISGRDADIAVPEEGSCEWDEASSHDELRWSPYHGLTFDARVIATYLRGKAVWGDATTLSQPGDGAYVPRATDGWYANEEKH